MDLSKQQNLNYQSSLLADKIWIKEPSLQSSRKKNNCQGWLSFEYC